ncbi:GTP diphosphokinase [Ectothiorhodospiraceae bacterium WFHF3C12]|nr:GTP diphosphokinase [Ectothiorhodospiraceae bacterium WFHF3C12]
MVQVTGEFDDLLAKGEVEFADWRERLPIALSPEEAGCLERAWRYALEAYGGRKRDSGEPYFEHALSVAGIVAELRLDADTIAAALLHDLPKLPGYQRDVLREGFGRSIVGLVEGVDRMSVITDLAEGPSTDNEERQSEALRKMLLAVARDMRVVFITLAELLHDLRVAKHQDETTRRRIAREAHDIYAPLANRLGIWQIKWEMEDLSFRYLEPDTYKRIASLLAERRVDRERYIAEVKEQISGALERAGIDAEVSGRPKHIYSIWRKMQRKGVDFHELFDIRAFRIMVRDVAACYSALGVVHSLWKPIPREFDDYIATPKENNYQSLHTAVVGPEGKTLEVQIRTREMHQEAELGIAAHWRYKEGGKQDPAYEQKVAWLRQIFEWGKEETGARAFLDRIKDELFEDRVYVITPRGEVMDLPRGATPLDFAYHVHSEVGHRCRGAKVNGRMVQLTHELQSGDHVEVLTSRASRPSRDWLNPSLGYVRTPRARAKIRAWFRQQDFDKNVSEGREVLDRELHRLGVDNTNLEQLAQRTRFGKLDDFLAAIGRGDVTGGQIASLLGDELLRKRPQEPQLPRGPGQAEPAGGDDDVTIYGVGNLLTRMARCCHPAPGDAIVGFITRGRGVTIHRQNCPNVARMRQDNSQRLIEVSWNRRTERRYPIEIHVEAYDRQGLIKDISGLLANERINVTAVNTHTDSRDHFARMSLTLEVTDVAQLSRVMDRIASLRNVRDVRRSD